MVASFLGGGQMNPFAADPMQMLSTAAMAGDQTPPVQAPAFADPATTGSVSAPPAASTAAPGGSSPSDNRGIMDRIGDAFSGRQGLFGSPSADNNEIDPTTGAPKGLARQAGMRSMMQMGLTFLMAGQRMSNDQRAAILSRAPGLIGGGDEALNSFAKTRLEMAKLRMEQQKMQQEQASSQALMQGLGIGGGSASTPSVGAQGIQAGQQALAQAAPVIDPQQAAMPVGAPAQAIPQGTAPAMPDQAPANAAADVSAAPMPTAPAGALAAPGGVPRMSGAGAGFDPKSLTQAEKLAIVSQPTTAGKSQMFGQIVAARSAGERIGEPQYNSVTGTIQYPKYNGRGEQTGFADGGKPTTTTRDTDKFREEGFTDPRTGQFVVTKRSDLVDKKGDAQDTASLQIAKGDRDTLNTEHHDIVQKSLDTYDRMSKVRNDVLDGKGVWGTGAGLRQKAYNALVSMGFNFDSKLSDSLNTNADFMRVMKEGVATTIKNFNGSANVSNTDLKFAQDVMQATTENNPEAVLNALTNGMKDIRENVGRYNVNAKRHNSDLSEFGAASRRLKVPEVDRDFNAPEEEYRTRMDARRAANSDTAPKASGPAPAENSGVVRYARDPKTGKIVRQ